MSRARVGGDPVSGLTHDPVSPLPAPERLSSGANLVGFLEAESGLGEVARRLAAVLETSDIPLAAIPYRGTRGRQEHSVDLPLADEAPYDTNVICLTGRDLAAFATEVGTGFFARRYSVGVWFWETSAVNADTRATTRYLDELWVASEYVRQSLLGEVDIPVHVVPVPVDVPRGPFRSRSELELPDAFTFLFVFDFWSVERKNPYAVVESFTKAFEPDEGPVLVLKSINGRDWKPRQLDRLEEIAGERRDIVLRDGYVSTGERDSYVAACDCYVSLHRSEGLGLTMSEAIALGKPVIATAYSGNLEFMSEDTSRLVPYRLVDVPEAWWGHTAGAQWAEPDVDAAASVMRELWERPDEARALGSSAREDILARFTRERTRSFVEGRLVDARTRGAVQARAAAHDSRPPILEASHVIADGIGGSLARSEGLRPASFVRRFLHRALWPYLEERARFEGAVVDALTTMHRSAEELEQRVLRLESRSDDSSTRADH